MGKALQFYPLVYPNDPNPSSFKAGTGWLKRSACIPKRLMKAILYIKDSLLYQTANSRISGHFGKCPPTGSKLTNVDFVCDHYSMFAIRDSKNAAQSVLTSVATLKFMQAPSLCSVTLFCLFQ